MNSHAASRRPLVPEDIDVARSFSRAAWAAVGAAARKVYAADYCEQLFPRDPVARQILLARAAPAGATTSDSAWAGALAARAVGEFLPSLAPLSAAAALIPMGTRVPVGDLPLDIPVLVGLPSAAPFVGEAGGIPLRAGAFTTVPIAGRKMGIMLGFSKELAAVSGAQSVFEELLRRTAAVSLDAAMFGTNVGTAVVHAGLLAGVVPLTAATGGGSPAMISDLTRLGAAVSAGGQPGPIAFVMSPDRAATTAMRASEVTVPIILGSVAVPATRVIAVSAGELLHGHGLDPSIDASENATIHFEDTSPVSVTAGAPSYSLYQAGMIGLRMVLPVAFGASRAGAVAYLDGASWLPA